jgi:hypothetical protein
MLLSHLGVSLNIYLQQKSGSYITDLLPTTTPISSLLWRKTCQGKCNSAVVGYVRKWRGIRELRLTLWRTVIVIVILFIFIREHWTTFLHYHNVHCSEIQIKLSNHFVEKYQAPSKKI